MTSRAGVWTRWWIVAAFAVGMAWVESACVFYLRVLVDRVQPYQPNPLPISSVLGQVELVREAATLVMLGAVGLLAGRTARSRLGYVAIAFGLWDIFYYVFLKLMCGWPSSLLDWDVLFLLPLPWWGPVLAPVSIAVLMIVWGTLASLDPTPRPVLQAARSKLGWLGVALALYVFMADALRVASLGSDAVRSVLPTSFNWALFAVALSLMAAPVTRTVITRIAMANVGNEGHTTGA